MRNCESFFSKHKFGKWEDYKEICCSYSKTITIIQKRTCLECGKLELRSSTNDR